MTTASTEKIASSRSCEECAACCQGWLSDVDLGMHPGQACRHLHHGRCAIYEQRPELPCRRFHCLWLRMPRLPDALRPDRCGAIAWVLGEGLEATLVLTPVGAVVPTDIVQQFCDWVAPIRMPVVYESRRVVAGQFEGVQRFRLEAPDYAKPRQVGADLS